MTGPRDRTKAPPKRRYRRPDSHVAIRPDQPTSTTIRDAGKRKAPSKPPAAGLDARIMAVDMLESVLGRGKTLDEALGAAQSGARQRALPDRDRALARLLAATVLRHRGRLSAVVGRFIERPLPREGLRAELILLTAAAQLLILGTPDHAAIYLAVAQAQNDPKAERYHKLANAVLRRVASQGPAIFAELDAVTSDMPAWLLDRWSRTYGPAAARQMAAACLTEAALDLTFKNPEEAPAWAERLKGRLLPTGSLRLEEHGVISELPGYDDGVWWVQDAAASLPARLLGNLSGKRVADLCAAPGGKTAQLVSAGAQVLALDHSAPRLTRLEENMRRLGFGEAVRTIQADLLDWKPAEAFDAVLLDAPCSATGTIRRHPDLLHLKTEADVTRLTQLQARFLAAASEMVAPGGTLIYCTCSLEPEEGPQQIEQFLAQDGRFKRLPATPAEVGGVADWVNAAGDLLTLPSSLPLPAPFKSGMDGFYAARLVRTG